MRLSIAAFASLLALVSAQGLGGLPDCAKSCAGPALPAQCGLDIKCICTAKSFIDAITCCVAAGCNMEDQQKAITFAKGICGTVDVNIPDAAICATGSGSSAATPSATGTGGATPSSPSDTGTETGGAGAGPNPTGTGAGAAGGQSATPTPAAGNKLGVGMGVGAGLALGVFGML